MIAAVPLKLADANAFIAAHHRHHKPVRFHLFSIGATVDGTMAGAVIVMRPVTQGRSFNGRMAEVCRLATDGSKNVCSFLLARAARAAFEMGYLAIQTYTLPDEGGASLRAAGWHHSGDVSGKAWSNAKRQRNDTHPLGPKIRWWKVRPDVASRFYATPEGRDFKTAHFQRQKASDGADRS